MILLIDKPLGVFAFSISIALPNAARLGITLCDSPRYTVAIKKRPLRYSRIIRIVVCAKVEK